MLRKTTGILLQTTNYSDSSIIVKAYTLEAGIQSYMINGVRGKKAKNKASVFQPLTIVELVAAGSDKNKLKRVTEINLQHPWSSIPYDIVKSSIALFLDEILCRSLKEEEPDEALFEYLRNALLILDLKTESCSNFHLCFLIQLTRFLGFYPQGLPVREHSFFDLVEGRFVSSRPVHGQFLEPGEAALLEQLMASDFEHFQLVEMTRLQRKNLLKGLVRYYSLHIAGFGEIRSLDVLEEVIG